MVANGELTVVHQNMHMFRRNACEADKNRKICKQGITGQTCIYSNVHIKADIVLARLHS